MSDRVEICQVDARNRDAYASKKFSIRTTGRRHHGNIEHKMLTCSVFVDVSKLNKIDKGTPLPPPSPNGRQKYGKRTNTKYLSDAHCRRHRTKDLRIPQGLRRIHGVFEESWMKSH